MSIYTTCHPIDDSFAAEILLRLSRSGIVAQPLPATDAALKHGDIIIVILRTEFICSEAYAKLIKKALNCTLLPILRSPISITDWSGNEILNPIIDFSSYSERQFAIGVRQLADILNSQNNAELQENNLPIDVYVRNLERESLHDFKPISLLETVNFANHSFGQHPFYKFLTTTSFEVTTGISPSTSKRSRIDNLINIAALTESSLVNCGCIDTSLVAGCLAATQRQVIDQFKTNTLTLFIDIRDWNREISSAQWLRNQVGTQNTILDRIHNSHITVYVHGLKHPSVSLHDFERTFEHWWNAISPALSLVILCPEGLYESAYTSKEPLIQIKKYSREQLNELCTSYPDRDFAKYMLIHGDDNNALHEFFVQNLEFASLLLSLKYSDGTNISELSLKDHFEQVIANLWGQDNLDDYTAIEDGISKIAAIMTGNRKDFLPYEDALSYIQSEPLLHRCIDVGIFSLNTGKIRFALSVLHEYFAAIALVKFGIPSHLPALTINSQSARIPQRWDKPLILASRFSTSGDKLEKLIRRIADNDPLLAIECLVGTGHENSQLRTYVIEKNLESLVNIGDFRTDFARHLYRFDILTAQAILLETLRDAKWEVRQYAYQTFIGLDFSKKAGLMESLGDLDEAGRANLAPLLKRIAPDAFPTLFHLLHNDDDVTRCNAIWALGETADKASVPALINLLHDRNVKVAILAARTIAKTHDLSALPYLIENLQHRHNKVRSAVTDTIMTLFDQHREEFIKVIRQVDISTRRQLVLYLSSSKLTKLKIDIFLEFTRDEDVDVRIAAIESLAATTDERVVARFKECLDDMSKSRLNKASVSEIVSRILSNVPHVDDGSKVHVKSSVPNSSQIVKARLLSAKAQQSTADAIPQNELRPERDHYSEDGYVAEILTQLRSRRWDTSNNAAKMLRDYMKSLRGNASSKVINQVLETLNDDDWVIRWTGVESLGWVGNLYVVPHLIQRLSDSNWKIRVAAIRALAEIKDNSAITGLSKLNTDTNSVVREAAAEALGFLDGKQAVFALGVFAKDTEDFVRLAGVESLGRICDKVAMPALLSALNDSSEHVRWAAANGIMGIADATIVSSLTPSLSDTGGPYWEQKRICDVIIDILKKINSDEAREAIADWQTNQA